MFVVKLYDYIDLKTQRTLNGSIVDPKDYNKPALFSISISMKKPLHDLLFGILKNRAKVFCSLYMNIREGRYHEIKRFTRKCLGKEIKFGKVSQDSQIILHGKSSTCSGDGNTININFNGLSIICPTIQFKSRSFDEIDWNRFWIEN